MFVQIARTPLSSAARLTEHAELITRLTSDDSARGAPRGRPAARRSAMRVTGYRSLASVPRVGRPVGNVDGAVAAGATEVPVRPSSRLDEGLTGVGLGGHTDGFEVSVAEGPVGPRGHAAGRRRPRRALPGGGRADGGPGGEPGRRGGGRHGLRPPARGRRGRRQPALPGDGRGDASCGTRTACRSSPTPSTPSWSRPYSPRARATRGTYPSNAPWCGRAFGTWAGSSSAPWATASPASGFRRRRQSWTGPASRRDRQGGADDPGDRLGRHPGGRRHVRQGHRTGC